MNFDHVFDVIYWMGEIMIGGIITLTTVLIRISLTSYNIFHFCTMQKQRYSNLKQF